MYSMYYTLTQGAVTLYIFRDRIIGPSFIEGNLDGSKYLELILQEKIVPAIQEIAGDDSFQQDGAPTHFWTVVRNYLNVVFNNRWIGRRGTIEWLARSPGLTPLGFLWGYLKSKVYATKQQDLDDLRQRIVDACASWSRSWSR